MGEISDFIFITEFTVTWIMCNKSTNVTIQFTTGTNLYLVSNYKLWPQCENLLIFNTESILNFNDIDIILKQYN